MRPHHRPNRVHISPHITPKITPHCTSTRVHIIDRIGSTTRVRITGRIGFTLDPDSGPHLHHKSCPHRRPNWVHIAPQLAPRLGSTLQTASGPHHTTNHVHITPPLESASQTESRPHRTMTRSATRVHITESTQHRPTTRATTRVHITERERGRYMGWKGTLASTCWLLDVKRHHAWPPRWAV